MRRIAIAAGAAALLAGPAAAEAPLYRPIPPGHDMPAGFAADGRAPTREDFAAGERRLLALLEAGDFAALRDHAWQVFAGLTAPTPEGWAVWESWYPSEVVYAGPQADPAPFAMARFSMHPARQHGLGRPGAPEPAAGASVAAAVLFNREARNHIWENMLHDPATLPRLNAAFDRDGAALKDRSIPQFPYDAVAVKTVWDVVPAEGRRVLPVWDGGLDVAEVALTPSYPPANWTRCVAVSAEPAPAAGPVAVTCNGHPMEVAVLSADAFYGFVITEAEVDAVREATGNKEAKAGDVAILTGLHFTTREIPNWVWATVWWHDRPDEGPFGAGRPDAVVGAWRNYRLAAAYDRDEPRAVDGGPAAAFNPYIEGKYPDGLRSNCMSCHVRAVYPRLPPKIDTFDMCGALPVTRGEASLPLDDPALGARTRLEFLWSILLAPRWNADDPCG